MVYTTSVTDGRLGDHMLCMQALQSQAHSLADVVKVAAGKREFSMFEALAAPHLLPFDTSKPGDYTLINGFTRPELGRGPVLSSDDDAGSPAQRVKQRQRVKPPS